MGSIVSMLSACNTGAGEVKSPVWLDEGLKIRRKPRKAKKKTARKGGRP